MPDYPPVVLGVITFDRPDTIRATLSALAHHLTYSGPLTVVIADDCTPGRYLRDLAQWWEAQGYPWPLKTLSTPRNGGWGWNANHLLEYTFGTQRAGYLFMQEDDYVLSHPLDLDAGVALMETAPQLGMLRYRATAGTPMLYHQREADISAWKPDYREYLGYTLGRVTWLELLPQSPTLWLYSNGPHLKRASFHDVYGLYPERLKLGATEEAYAHIVKDKMLTHPNTPRIGVLPAWVYMFWDHIGVSYQHTERDR